MDRNMSSSRRAASKNEISPDEAVEALSRSGYLLENRIARKLNGFATHLLINVLFSDPDTNQPRELDAYCFRTEASDTQEYLSASAHLLIECINNPQPIAFFSSTQTLNLYPILAARPAWLGTHPIEESIGIDSFHHSFKVPVSTNYCTFVPKKSSGEWMVTHADDQHGDFTTLSTLAQLTREKQLKVLEDLSRPQDAMEFCGIELIYPILVVEGTLFQVDQDPKGTVRLDPIEHVRYCKSQIWRGTRRYCPIDVVTEQYFSKLLNLIEEDCRQTLRRLEKRSDEVLEAARNEEYGAQRQQTSDDYLP
jgi:hypothetical protein